MALRRARPGVICIDKDDLEQVLLLTRWVNEARAFLLAAIARETDYAAEAEEFAKASQTLEAFLEATGLTGGPFDTRPRV